MASVHIANKEKGATTIDYSLVDGRVRSFVKHGKLIFDEDETDKVFDKDWQKELVKTVLENKLDIDKGSGLSAFVYRMQEDGLIPIKRKSYQLFCDAPRRSGSWKLHK